jgi:glyoxylase-like metal-dependent hydrolase (beta-lactamase superfamily II)
MTHPNRREFIQTAAGAAAAAMAAPYSLTSHAHAGNAHASGYHRYSVGDIRCTALYDGIWRKEHAADFIINATVEETKGALEAGGLPADFVTIEFTQTLIETAGRRILIDPGTGGQWVPTAGIMPDSLAAAGLASSDIDMILISHFHPDHIFGLMQPDTDAQVFPDAEIIVPAAEYNFWTDPQVFAAVPEAWHGLARRIQKTFPMWPNVTRASHGQELAPGIRSLAAPGHTPGHTAYHVSSGAQELIVAGDVAITPALFVAHPGWHIAFDADPETAETTRRQLFDRIVADQAVVAGYHFGFPNAGRITPDGAGYRFEPFGL